MKVMFILILIAYIPVWGNCQSGIDSIDLWMEKSVSDTAKINLQNQKLLLLNQSNLDSGIAYGREVVKAAGNIHYLKGETEALINLSVAYSRKGRFELAKETLRKAEQVVRSTVDSSLYPKLYAAYGNVYGIQGKYDSSVQFYEKALLTGGKENNLEEPVKNNLKSGQDKMSSQVDLSQLILWATAILILILALGGWIILRSKYKFHQALTAKNSEIKDTQKQLSETQAQLIQSEKMASMGELTAGIAHEIQNPLNFVNNFSELNGELINELLEERNKVVRNMQHEEDLLKDLKENEDRINYHGKRADAIVKNMLQHSGKSTGQKEPTDINALADEYLRLSFHGLRAKDKGFNATLDTGFDDKLTKVNIIPQEMGRVFLNLFNNAFYAVAEKKKRDPGLDPTVTVVTSSSPDGAAIIKIKDNGIGIPKKIVDKIFQPFFTTKPAKEGTGIGLSLSYDIVKAHGGTFEVNSEEGEFTEFIIRLPRGSVDLEKHT